MGLTHSTIKVYLASISACHVGYDGKRILGYVQAGASSRPVFRYWDLAVVIGGLCKLPFEPLRTADLKISSLTSLLLVALTTAKWVSGMLFQSPKNACASWMMGSLSGLNPT